MFKFTVNSQHLHCDFDFHRSESLNFTFELQPLILSKKKKRRKKERNKQKTSKKKKQRKKVTTSLLTTIHLINNILSAFYIIEHFIHFLCAFKNHSLCIFHFVSFTLYLSLCIFYYISTQQDVNLRRCGYSSPTRCQTLQSIFQFHFRIITLFLYVTCLSVCMEPEQFSCSFNEV